MIFNNLDFFELIKKLYKTFLIVNYLINEIHHLKNYSQILKNIYDLLPVKIVFSWSNMINLLSSKYDLSRSVVSYNIPIFSFKEFLLFKYEIDLKTFDLKYLLSNHLEISRKYFSKVIIILSIWAFFFHDKNSKLRFLNIFFQSSTIFFYIFS